MLFVKKDICGFSYEGLRTQKEEAVEEAAGNYKLLLLILRDQNWIISLFWDGMCSLGQSLSNTLVKA